MDSEEPIHTPYHLPLYQRIGPKTITLEASRSTSSLQIPGSMVIDPLAREIANRDGLKVTENAIWALVIAAREYTLSVLRETVSFVEELKTLDELNKECDNEHTDAKKRTRTTLDQSDELTCITARHMHAMIASEPAGTIRSLSNRFSRTAFERSLHTVTDPNIPVAPSDFNPVQRFVSKSILMPGLKRRRLIEPPIIRSKSNLQQDRRNSDEISPRATANASPPPVSSANLTSASEMPSVTSGGTDINALPVPVQSDVQVKDSLNASSIPSDTNSHQVASPRTSPQTLQQPTERDASMAPPSAQELSSRQKSSSPAPSRSGGVGRGAKDLASLLARSKSITTQATSATTGEQQTVAQNTALSETVQVGLLPTGEISNPAGRATTVVADDTRSTLFSGSCTPAIGTGEPDSQQQQEFNQIPGTQERRGKGFGIKNLKSMLVRSQPGNARQNDKE
jgi:hypothetical protein